MHFSQEDQEATTNIQLLRSTLLQSTLPITSRYQWQELLDVLRLQQLPHARQVIQRCRTACLQEQASAAPDAAGAQPSANVMKPDAQEEHDSNARHILCKMAVSTGLTLFFFMLERDPEAKSFLLQSVSAFIADLKPLALHDALGQLELESLAKVEAFLLSTSASVQAPPRTAYGAGAVPSCSQLVPGTADNALNCLIGLALARGSLSTNLSLARLLFSSPHILKAHHLRQIRRIADITQTWCLETERSSSVNTNIFRPRPCSTDALIAAWEDKVLPLLPALDEDTRRVQRLAVLAALRENKTQEAIRIFGDFFARHAGDAARQQGDGNAGRPQDEVDEIAQGCCGCCGKVVSAETPLCIVGGVCYHKECYLKKVDFPSLESLAKERAARGKIGGGIEEDECGMSGEDFLQRLEASLERGESCNGPQACAAVMVTLQLLAARLELPQGIPQHMTNQSPAHCIADDSATCSALFQFVTDVCGGVVSGRKSGHRDAGGKEPLRRESGAEEADASSEEQVLLQECARRRIVYAWLALVRVNLDWKSRRYLLVRGFGSTVLRKDSKNSNADSNAWDTCARDAGTAEEDRREDTASLQMQELERQLRDVILRETGKGGGGDRKEDVMCEALCTEAAQWATLECYAAGIPLFFQEPSHLGVVLQPLLFAVRSGTASPLGKQLCARLLWNFSDYQMLWRAMSDATERATVEEVGGSGGDKAGKPRSGSSDVVGWNGLGVILECALQALFLELQGYLIKGLPSGVTAAGLDRNSIKIRVPVSWRWGRFTASAMSVDASGMVIQKTCVSPDYSVALSSAGFSTGIHEWVLRVDICQRLVVGVCPGGVDLDRRVNGAWAWHSHGAMCGPDQHDQETVDYSNRDTLRLKLDMDRGTLQFFKNDEFKGCLHKVTGEVFPFVCMDYEGEQVTLIRRYDVLEREEGSGAELDLAVVCSRTLQHLMGLLIALMEEERTPAWQNQLAATALEQSLDNFSQFLECIDSHMRTESCTETHAYASKVLGVLDFVALGATSRPQHLLGWLPSVLVFAERLEAAAGGSGNLVQSMVKCVMAQRRFIFNHRPLLTYHGTYFRSFALRGATFSKANTWCSVEHLGPLSGEWTLEVLAKRGQLNSGCTLSVLLATEDFALSLDQQKGDVSTIKLIDYTAGDRGRANKDNIFAFDSAVLPSDTWMMICLLSANGMTTLYVDGSKVGVISKSFALKLTSVGASTQNPSCEYFCGSVRELRVLSRALSRDEIIASMSEGLVNSRSEALVPEHLVLFLEFPGKDEVTVRTVAQGGSTKCTASFKTDRGVSAGKVGEARDQTKFDGGVGEEEHWLCKLAKILNGITGSMATQVVCGQQSSEKEAVCDWWLNSPLFAPGFRSAAACTHPYVEYLVQGAHDGQTEAAAQQNQKAHMDILMGVLQPLLAVRLSHHLDALECSVMATILYHCGELNNVLSSAHAFPTELQAIVQAVSLAARGVRRHVMEKRDLANLVLTDNEEPLGWHEFCSPILHRCRLLLRLAPMHVQSSPRTCTRDQEEHCTENSVHGSGQSSSSRQALHVEVEEVDVKDQAQARAAVYSSIRSHVHGSTHVNITINLVTGFLKESIEADEMVSGLQRRQSKAVQVQLALSALVQLLGETRMSPLKRDLLFLLAKAANPWKHYLSKISASGQLAEEQVRGCFHDLIDNLVGILHTMRANQGRRACPKALVAVANSLTVVLDKRDLVHIVKQTKLVNVLNAFWTGLMREEVHTTAQHLTELKRENAELKGERDAHARRSTRHAYHSKETETSTRAPDTYMQGSMEGSDQLLLRNPLIMQSLNRLLVSMLLGLGSHASEMETEVLQHLLACANLAVSALFGIATSTAGAAGGSWKYWHGQWRNASGRVKAHKLLLILHVSEDSVSAHQVLHGSVRYKHYTYKVHGAMRMRQAQAHSLLLRCSRVDFPASPSLVQPFESEAASQNLTLVGSITNDLRFMQGQIYNGQYSPQSAEGASGAGPQENIGVFESYSVSSLPVPSSYFSRYTRRTIMLSGGFVQFVGELEECGVVQAGQPVTPTENYLEVHVVESHNCNESAVAIGLAGRNYALDQMPGWQVGSIAYHLDDGNLFVQAGDPARFGPVCVQGDVVGCRVKFSADGVSPESLHWTRNGEHIGSKYIYRTPGLSMGSNQLFFTIGLNRPGEKVLVSTGMPPDLPGDSAPSSTSRASNTERFDTKDLEEGLKWYDVMALNEAARFEDVDKDPVLCLAAESESSTTGFAHGSGPACRMLSNARGGQAMYIKTLDFSQGSFSTFFRLRPRHDSRRGPLAGLAFVLSCGCLQDDVTQYSSKEEVNYCDNCLPQHVEQGRVHIVLSETLECVDDSWKVKSDVGYMFGPPNWQLKVKAGGRLVALSEVFPANQQDFDIWIKYCSERHFLQVFGCPSVCTAKLAEMPDGTSPLLTAHVDIASYVGETARVGFCCETTGDHNEEMANRAEDGYKILSWKLETTHRIQMDEAQLDASKLRAAASKELTTILSGLQEVGQSKLLRNELQQPRWQSLMWSLVFSSSLDIKARSHALEAVALSLLQPDVSSTSTTSIEACRASVEKLLWLVASLSPEYKFFCRGGTGASGAGTSQAQTRLPSVVTWSIPKVSTASKAQVGVGESKGVGNCHHADPDRLDGHRNIYAPFLPCLEFRSRVVSLIKHLSSLPHRRSCVSSAMLKAIRQIGQSVDGTEANEEIGAEIVGGSCASLTGMSSLHGLDLASIMVLGGVLDVFVLVGKQGHQDEGLPFEASVLDAFLEMACSQLASVDSHPRERSRATLRAQIKRTRIAKAVWELVALPCVRELVSSKYPDLIRVLLKVSEDTNSRIPLTYLNTAGTSPDQESAATDTAMLFDLSSVQSSRVYITNGGSICDIRSSADCSVMVGPKLQKGSGKHYVEYKILVSRGDYSLIGCAAESYRTSNVIGDYKGSWAWANDGDFKAGGDWCGDRGLSTFRSGDHVGVLVDTDSGALRFTKNGKLLRKTCSLNSALATGEYIRMAVGSNSHLKIEIANSYKYRFVREAVCTPSVTPWLTVEMVIAKCHLLSLEGGLGCDAVDRGGNGQTGTGDLIAKADYLHPCQSAERERICKTGAHLLARRGMGQALDSTKENAGKEKDGLWTCEALFQKGLTEEVFFAEKQGVPKRGQIVGARNGAWLDTDSWASPWHTSGSKLELLVQCEASLLRHYVRLSLIDLLRARHTQTAMRIDAPGLISLLAPLFPNGHTGPRTIFSTGAYADVLPVADEVLAGWVSARGDEHAETLAHELRCLAQETSQALQHMVLLRRLSMCGIKSLLDFTELHRENDAPSVTTWVLPTSIRLLEEATPCHEMEIERVVSFQLAAWLSTHLGQRYALSGHPACGPSLTQLQERLIEAISVTSSQPLCLSLLKALLVAVSHRPEEGGVEARGALVEGPGQMRCLNQVVRIGEQTRAAVSRVHSRVRWSTSTLQMLEKLRTAALQQLVQQQHVDIAKQRVLHTPFLQALVATVVAVDTHVHATNVQAILMGHLSAAAVLSAPVTSPLSPAATGEGGSMRSAQTQKVVEKLIEMGFMQEQIDEALSATANEHIEDLSSQCGTQVLNYLSTCSPSVPPSDGNFPLAPHPGDPFAVPLEPGDSSACTREGAGGETGRDDAGCEAGSARQPVQGGEASSCGDESNLRQMWSRVADDCNMGKALLAMESITLLSHALHCLEDDGKLPLWLLDMAKRAGADQRQFLSWDNSDAVSGMVVGKSCLFCQRSSLLPEKQWATVTGNLPFHFSANAAAGNDGDHFFSIRVSRLAAARTQAKDSDPCDAKSWTSLMALGMCFGVIRTSELSSTAQNAPMPAHTRASLRARGYAAGSAVLLFTSNGPVVSTFNPSSLDPACPPSEREGNGIGRRRGNEDAASCIEQPALSQKSFLVCERRERSFHHLAPLSPQMKEEYVRKIHDGLLMDEVPSPSGALSPDQTTGKPRSTTVNGKDISASCPYGTRQLVESIYLTVQVTADHRINFFEGQGAAATLIVQTEMADGHACPGSLVPFVSLQDPDVVCEVLAQGCCSAPPMLHSCCSPDKCLRTLRARSSSILAGPNGFPGSNSLSRALFSWEMATDPCYWPSSMDSLLVQYATERAVLKEKKLSHLLPSDLFDEDAGVEPAPSPACETREGVAAGRGTEAALNMGGRPILRGQVDASSANGVGQNEAGREDAGGGPGEAVGGHKTEAPLSLGSQVGNESGLNSTRSLPGVSPILTTNISPLLTRAPLSPSPAVRSTCVTSPNVAAAISVSPLSGKKWGPFGRGDGGNSVRGNLARHFGEYDAAENAASVQEVGSKGSKEREEAHTQHSSEPNAPHSSGALRSEVSMITLNQLPRSALRARFAVLKAFNDIARLALPLVDLRLYEDHHNLAHMLARNKGRLFMYNKEIALQKSLDLSRDSTDVPHITINRGTIPADCRRWDKTVFYQVFRALEERTYSLRVVDRRGQGKQSWVTTFEGEGGSDHGGLFRDSLREMCAELQAQAGEGGERNSFGLQLLVPCPNQRYWRGANQDKWMPRPLRRRGESAEWSPGPISSGGESSGVGQGGGGGLSEEEGQRYKMLHFLGALMGASLRTGSALELDLPSIVWKPLVGELCDMSDLAAIDQALAADLMAIRDCASPHHWSVLARGLKWRILSVTGRWIELIPGGADRLVLWEERMLFVDEAVRVRLGECDAEIEAIKAGFTTVVPSLVLPLLTWRELEAKVCGTPVIDVEVLKKITEHNLPRKEKHPVAVMFWQIVSDMSNSDRAALLAFVSGRRRLPSHGGGSFKMELLHGRGDEALPEAHTCFFTLDLPEYSTLHVMREKLLYAVNHCSAIDKDFTALGGSLYDPDASPSATLEAQGVSNPRGGMVGVAELGRAGEKGEGDGKSESGGLLLGSSLLHCHSWSLEQSEEGDPVDEGHSAGEAAEPLTAETLRRCWNSAGVSRPFWPTASCVGGATHDSSLWQLSIPRDGGHDEAAQTWGSGRAGSVAGPGAVDDQGAAGSREGLTIEQALAHRACSDWGMATDWGMASPEALRNPHMAMWGLWDEGMLDRMQAADVHSGVPGIDDQMTDSAGEEEEGGDEEDDEDQDDEDQEDEQHSPQDGDEEDASESGSSGGIFMSDTTGDTDEDWGDEGESSGEFSGSEDSDLDNSGEESEGSDYDEEDEEDEEDGDEDEEGAGGRGPVCDFIESDDDEPVHWDVGYDGRD